MAAFLLGIRLYEIAVNLVAQKFIYSDTGTIVDYSSLPQPLYPSKNSITAYDQPDGRPIATLSRAVVYPNEFVDGWIQVELYGWVWNEDLTDGLGTATVKTDTAEFRPGPNFVPVASIDSQATVTKLYINQRNSWALCLIEVWFRQEDLRTVPSTLEKILNSEYPIITWTSKEVGDVQGSHTVTTLHEAGPMIIILTGFALWLPINLLILRRRSKSMTTNFITISGVTSSSINVQSPLASALLTLDEKGKTDAAVTLLQLKDLVEQTKMGTKKKQQVRELLDTIAEEAKRPEPRKTTLSTLIKEFALITSSVSVIADKVPPLIEKVSQLWK